MPNGAVGLALRRDPPVWRRRKDEGIRRLLQCYWRLAEPLDRMVTFLGGLYSKHTGFEVPASVTLRGGCSCQRDGRSAVTLGGRR